MRCHCHSSYMITIYVFSYSLMDIACIVILKLRPPQYSSPSALGIDIWVVCPETLSLCITLVLWGCDVFCFLSSFCFFVSACVLAWIHFPLSYDLSHQDGIFTPRTATANCWSFHPWWTQFQHCWVSSPQKIRVFFLRSWMQNRMAAFCMHVRLSCNL